METVKLCCPGCGAPFQSKSADQPGYRLRDDQILCQRCFRLKHYGDTRLVQDSAIELTQVLREIRVIEGTLVVLIDLVNFDPRLIDVLESSLHDKEVVLVFTKRDLLPKTLSLSKISRLVQRSLKGRHLRVRDALTVSIRYRASVDFLRQRILELEGDVIIAGMVNAGKSSLINALTQTQQLTVSPHAHTTLAIQAIPFEGKRLYDTPGFHVVNALEGLSVDEAARYAITSPLKPQTYQINGDQTFIIGDLAALRIVAPNSSSVTVYVSGDCPIHRSGPRAKTYLSTHVPRLANCPETVVTTDNVDGVDVVIAGLGWLSLKGSFESVAVQIAQPEWVSLRKALL